MRLITTRTEAKTLEAAGWPRKISKYSFYYYPKGALIGDFDMALVTMTPSEEFERAVVAPRLDELLAFLYSNGDADVGRFFKQTTGEQPIDRILLAVFALLEKQSLHAITAPQK